MRKLFIALSFITLSFITTGAHAGPVCIINELGSDDVQMSNTNSTKVDLYPEDDKLKDFSSTLFPQYSFKANHYGSTLYVGIYKDGQELARSGGKDWVQLVSKQPGKNPFGVIIVDCYSKSPSGVAALTNSESTSNQTGYNSGYSGVSCPTGQVNTQYGCLTAVTAAECGAAPTGQAFAIYNGACVLGPLSIGYSNGHLTTGYPYSGQCAAGSVMTQMNCLPINPQACFGSYNYGYLNGYCYPAQTGYNSYNNYNYPNKNGAFY